MMLAIKGAARPMATQGDAGPPRSLGASTGRPAQVPVLRLRPVGSEAMVDRPRRPPKSASRTRKRFTLRLPPEMHANLRIAAAAEGVSANSWLVRRLAVWLRHTPAEESCVETAGPE